MTVGNTILQLSKLHFLRFIWFLKDHLTEGSYRLVYADTDSIAMACTGTPDVSGLTRGDKMRAIFDPMLKDDKKKSFYNEWINWFVLTDRVEDIRKPGLLKSKSCF